MGQELGKSEAKTTLNSLCIFTELRLFGEHGLEEGEADLELWLWGEGSTWPETGL